MHRPTLMQIEEAVFGDMTELGFSPTGPGRFDRALGGPVFGVLTFTFARDTRGIIVSIDAGIRHSEITGLVRKMRPAPARDARPETLRTPIAGLIPYHRRVRWGWWRFLDELLKAYPVYHCFPHGCWTVQGLDELRAAVPHMRAAIEAHAIPFMEAHRDLPAIVRALTRDDRFIGITSPGYEAAAGLYMMGRYGEAFTMLESRLKRWRRRFDGGANEFRAFSRALIERMEADGWKPPVRRMQAALPLLAARNEALIESPV